MAGDLSVLIRLHKHELDEKQKELKELYDRLELLEEKQQKLREDMEREKRAVEQSGDDIHFTYDGFRRKAAQEQSILAADIAKQEKKIFTVRDQMLDIYGEMKRYDIAQDLRRRLEADERRLAETKSLDEIALETFRRNAE
jgi:hypothetical protein